MKKVLFILKYRENSFDCHTDPYSYGHGLSSGLFNSANFVNEMLNKTGTESKLVQVVDNNCIDREVTKFNPDIVIIEAYWVVPEKFTILTKRHPNVVWVIRNHSETPFLANEGIAFGWTLDYLKHKNVVVSSNTIRTNEEMRDLVRGTYSHMSEKEIEERVVFLPNYYPINKPMHHFGDVNKNHVNIGCFGAIRPLKNHMVQAIAAIRFADKIGKKLHFHINGGRVEGRGEPILKNLRELFDRQTHHELIEHGWLNHESFVENLVYSMDYGLQVSFSETFNIVAADFVKAGVPIVTSNQVPWISACDIADPNDSEDIANALMRARRWKWIREYWNPSLGKLHRYNDISVRVWYNFIHPCNA